MMGKDLQPKGREVTRPGHAAGPVAHRARLRTSFGSSDASQGMYERRWFLVRGDGDEEPLVNKDKDSCPRQHCFAADSSKGVAQTLPACVAPIPVGANELSPSLRGQNEMT